MKKKIFFKGPLLTRSGYGEQARFALRALRSRPDLFDIFIQPLEWGKTSWISEEDEERKWIDDVIEKTLEHVQNKGQFDISFQVTIPNEWEKIAPLNIGFTAGMETTKVAPEWLQKGNEMDGIIVVSTHSKRTYEDSQFIATNTATQEEVELKLSTPIVVVNYPIKKFPDSSPLELDLKYDFNFLTVAQMGPRKNLPTTIKWFMEEFKDDEVGLVVKTNMAKNCIMDREKVLHDMQRFVAGFKDHKCKVYLLHGDMEDTEMHSLIKHPKLKASLCLSHGEGFGLPLFEAAYTEMPVIATGWSGQLDFLVNKKTGKSEFYSVDCDIQPIPPEVVWEGVIIKQSMWAYPREQSAKQRMRECYANYEEAQEMAQRLTARLEEEFSEEKQNKEMVDAVCNVLKMAPEKKKEIILEFE